MAGIPEQIIEGKTGFVVDLDEKKLSEILEYIIERPKVLPLMGKASYGLFQKNFTIEAMVSKYAGLYKGIVSRH